MKVKDAIELLRGKQVEEIDLANLYHGELERRCKERWRSGQIPMIGVGLSDGRSKYLMRIFNEQAFASANRALRRAEHRLRGDYE